MAIERIIGIVIDTVKHSDKYNIVTLYTRSRGRMTFLSPVCSGKNGRLRKARLMPLAVVESEVKFVANRELQFLGAINPVILWRDLYYNPIKSSLVMFISEFLNKFLRQSVPDTAMWDYICMSLRGIDQSERSVANRHIAFLIGLLPHAGIEPKLEWEGLGKAEWFDMRDGAVTNLYPAHRDVIGPSDLEAMKQLMRMTGANSHVYRFGGTERRRVLQELLHYYAVHYPGLDQLKTLGVLTEAFS